MAQYKDAPVRIIPPGKYARESFGKPIGTYTVEDGKVYVSRPPLALRDANQAKYGAIADSAAVSMYRPAQHTKPPGILNRIGNKIARETGRWVDPKTTTQQGSAASSPSTYFQTLWPQRYEKQQFIFDCNNQWLSDPACMKSINMYVEEAFRGAFKIRVLGTDSMAKEAQAIADDYAAMWEDDLCGYGRCLLLAGELWPQFVVKDDQVASILNLPAVGMERCTDDADEFIDPRRAYSQFDAVTYSDLTYFRDWQISQVRWNHIPGQKLGIPDILPVRRMSRMLELMEASKVTQVQVRAPMRYLWTFGDKDNTGNPAEIEQLMAMNGFVEGKRQIFDPTETARDMFGNGLSDVKAIEGDSRVGEIEHLRYFLDRICNGYPTPRQLMALGSENINRDVLKDIKAQWMASTTKLTDAIKKPIKHGLEIAWILQDIVPSLLKYEVLFTKSTIETEQDRIDSLVALSEAKLVSRKTAVTMLQQYTQVPDVEAEIAEIDKENRQQMELNQEFEPKDDKGKDDGLGGAPVRRSKKPDGPKAGGDEKVVNLWEIDEAGVR
jgi:hypothetical protein